MVSGVRQVECLATAALLRQDTNMQESSDAKGTMPTKSFPHPPKQKKENIN